MHGKHSKAICEAFEAAFSRVHDDEADNFISDKAENAFYDLFDLIYDTESYILSDTIEAAFSQGQKYPNKERYTVWWGSSICWFLGTEEEILARLNAFPGELPEK